MRLEKRLVKSKFINIKDREMKNVFVLILFVIGMVTFSSCTKDIIKPIIAIASPVSNASYKVGDSFPLTATVTDETELAKISIPALSSLGDITTFDSPNAHVLNYSVTISEGTPVGPLTLVINAEDKEGNVGSGTVTVNVVE